MNFFKSKAFSGPISAPLSMHAKVLMQLSSAGLAPRTSGKVIPLPELVISVGDRPHFNALTQPSKAWGAFQHHNDRDGRTPESPYNKQVLIGVMTDDDARASELTGRLNKLFAKYPAVRIHRLKPSESKPA